MNRKKFFVILILIIISPVDVKAFYFGGEKSLSLSGAFSAVADDNGAIFINPAGIAQRQTYSTEINHQKDKVPGSNLWGITLVDYQSSPIAAGFAYYKMGRDYFPMLSDREELFVLTLAEPIGTGLFFGANFKYIKQRHHTRDDQTYDMGLLYAASPQIRFALVGKNLGDTKMDADFPKLYTAGVSYMTAQGIVVSYDITKDEDTKAEEDIIYSLGVDLSAMKRFNLRGGYMVDKVQDKKFYSAGIGYVANGFSLNYSFMRDEVDSDNIIHSFSLKLN